MDFKNVDVKLKKTADFLRSSKSGMKLHEGIMADKRVEVFKGGAAVKALMSSKYSAKSIATAEEAQKLLKEMMENGFFLRASRVNNTKHLQPDLSRTWSDDAYYAWVYQGSQLFTIMGALLLLIISFSFVMYPLWPASMRNIVWYLFMAGIGFICFLIVLAIVRLIVFSITVFTNKPGIWLFPNLFEDVGFFESFVPVWAWHRPEKSD